MRVLYIYLYSLTMRARRELSVTEASARGVAALAATAAAGDELIITRRGAPVASVVGTDRLRELDDLCADLRDLALVIARGSDDSGRRTTLDDARAAFRPPTPDQA